MQDDQRWIAAACRGNRSAFRRLVEKYQQYVFTVALKILRNRELAEEVAQDVFIKVYHTLSTFEGKSKFSTWLYTITYRAAIDELRKKSIQTAPLSQHGGSDWQDDLHEDGLTRTSRLDLREQLHQAIDRLDPEDAGIITLFYLQEQSVREIATVTGLTETNVKTKLYRLRDKLREMLQQQLGKEVMHLL